MGRSPCCDDNGLKKGPWTPEEDHKLVEYIQKHGHGSWRALPKNAGLNRCGKSCRLRWTNYLRPDIKRGKFSQEEEQTILHLHSILGNKWSAIATHLPGRTDNEIKNFWNTHLKKKLIQMGFDPTTHRPRTDLFGNLSQLFALANLREMVLDHPWNLDHAFRIQAEASQMAKLQHMQYLIQVASVMTNGSSGTVFKDMDAMNFSAPISLLSSMPEFHEESINRWDRCKYHFDNADGLHVDPNLNKTHIHPEQIITHTSAHNLQILPNFETINLNHHGSDVLHFNNLEEETPKSSAVMPPLPFESADYSSMNNQVGISTGTGNGSSAFWNEFFLEDPSFIHEVV